MDEALTELPLTNRPRVRLDISNPQYAGENENEAITLTDLPVVEATLERNSVIEADKLSVKLDGRTAGCDPRLLRNARLLFWMWDENYEVFDRTKHLRFVGIVKSAERKIEDDESIDLVAVDYTTLFIESSPFPPDHVPEWTDTLQTAWWRVCDGTGYFDADKGEIVSSVEALRDRIVFRLKNESIATQILGSTVHPRFLKLGKPTPPRGANSWKTWLWICGSLGVTTFIEKDTIVVTDTESLYTLENPVEFARGRNIASVEEKTDAGALAKSVRVTSYDPITRRGIESVYPPPGDPRTKIKRQGAVSRKKPKPITDTDVANDADSFEAFFITDQAALDRRAKLVYEQRSRQELEGRLVTPHMHGLTHGDVYVDLLSLGAGDSISVRLDDESLQTLAGIGSVTEIKSYLVDILGYGEDLARIVAQNANHSGKLIPIHHVKKIMVKYADMKYELEITYHNLIR